MSLLVFQTVKNKSDLFKPLPKTIKPQWIRTKQRIGVLKQRVSPKDVTVQDAVVFKIDGIDAIIFADGTMWQFQGRLLPRDATAESDNRSFCFK